MVGYSYMEEDLAKRNTKIMVTLQFACSYCMLQLHESACSSK